MGGKTHSTNDQVVQQQKEEAAAAAVKEQQRQTRLKVGLTRIKNAFEGKPVTAPTALNWSTFQPPKAGAAAGTQPTGVPAGYTAFQTTAPAVGKATRGSNIGQAGGPVPGTQIWALKDAKGNVFYRGQPLTYNTPVNDPATGQPEKTGGFDDAFYNNYKQGILDYYMPQVDKQMADATKELTYRLARAGTLTSSAANTATADLGTQYQNNLTGIRNQADTAAGDLRTKTAAEEQKAIQQLYATEDPTLATNTASESVRNLELNQPAPSTPLGQIFNIATVGAGNLMKGINAYNTSNLYNQAFGAGGSAGSGGGVSSGQRVVG